MDKIRYKDLKKGSFVEYWKKKVITYEDIKKLPVNLQRVARRELRNENIQLPKRKSKRKVKRIVTLDPELEEYEQDKKDTIVKLRQVLRNSILSDIDYDLKDEELLGEIAFAEGRSTTIYIEREGLSTLTILLPQNKPTIANLKRAIEVVSRAQLLRENRERIEDRIERQRKLQQHVNKTSLSETSSNNVAVADKHFDTNSKSEQARSIESKSLATSQLTTQAKSIKETFLSDSISTQDNMKATTKGAEAKEKAETDTDTKVKTETKNEIQYTTSAKEGKAEAKSKAKTKTITTKVAEEQEEEEEEIVKETKKANKNKKTKRQLNYVNNVHHVPRHVASFFAAGNVAGHGAYAGDVANSLYHMPLAGSLLEPILSTGELVCSVACNGHAHRPNVSWRFLWRAYALYNLDTKNPIDDTDGRKLLSDLGIENGTTLKFNPRVKYFQRKRQ